MSKRRDVVLRAGIRTEGTRMVDGLWRGDGRLERICPHGVGHTVYDESPEPVYAHGCDGCCKDYPRPK